MEGGYTVDVSRRGLYFSSLLPLYSNTLSSLVEESGCHLEHPKAACFRAHVIAGEWDEVRCVWCDGGCGWVHT